MFTFGDDNSFGTPGHKLGFIALGMAFVSLIFIAERESRQKDVIDGLVDRTTQVPNYNLLWSVHDMVFIDGASGFLNTFGKDLLLANGNWQTLCHMDSDGDGRTNGEEMGDPCCAWMAHTGQHRFAVENHQEYRRWLLSDPGRSDTASRLPHDPSRCGKYNQTQYSEQYHNFYFAGLDRVDEPAHLEIAETSCFLVFVATVVFWIARKDFLTDLMPLTCVDAGTRRKAALAVLVGSFFFLDVLSGVVHIVLDFAPHWLPVMGPLAYGTQLHHHDTTAFLHESPVNHVGHVHLILPIIPILVIASNGSRLQRLWWFWTAVWAHLFQFTHRWSHIPSESLPWLLLAAQSAKLLLTQDHHMKHHQDNSINFCFLSGQIGSDALLNFATRIVGPTRYDLWIGVLMGMLLLPAVIDWYVRSYLLRNVSMLNGSPSDEHDGYSVEAPTEASAEEERLLRSCRQYGLGMHDTGMLATVGVAPGPGLRCCVIACAILTHLLPDLFLLFSYCSEFGCFAAGCDQHSDNQCIPPLSNTELLMDGHPDSRFRYVLTYCVTYLRAPIMAFLMHCAYQRIREDSKSMSFSIFSYVVIFLAALEIIMTSVVPNDGSTRVLHVVASAAFIGAWLGVAVPLYANALSKAGHDALPIWSMWLIILAGSVWLAASWSIFSGVQWYACEWACTFGNSVLLMVIGATLPRTGDHKKAVPCC